MGKFPYLHTDSDETDNTSSVENLKKKRKPSILKYTSTTGNVKKKCKIHSKSEPEDSDGRSRSSHSQSFKSRIQGILKHDKDRTRSCSSDDDEDVESKDTPSQSKYLVGRVPRPAGCKPGRGGGVAIIVKREVKNAYTWSDLKNNTKRKAAKVNRAASGTGGGPASKLKLSDIEERVLGIMNPQAVTGMLDVHEVGLGQDILADSLITAADVLLDTATSNHGYDDRDHLESWNESGSSSQTPMFAPAIPGSQQSQTLPPQSQPQIHTPQSQQPQRPSPTATPPPVTLTARRRHLDHRSSTTGQSSRRKRTATTTQSDIARQSFINSDLEWRALKKEKEEKAYELEKERLRLREIELQQQAKWQEICAQFLLVIEKLGNSIIINKDK